MIVMIIIVFKLRVVHRTGHHVGKVNKSHFSASNSSKGTTFF